MCVRLLANIRKIVSFKQQKIYLTICAVRNIKLAVILLSISNRFNVFVKYFRTVSSTPTMMPTTGSLVFHISFFFLSGGIYIFVKINFCFTGIVKTTDQFASFKGINSGFSFRFSHLFKFQIWCYIHYDRFCFPMNKPTQLFSSFPES